MGAVFFFDEVLPTPTAYNSGLKQCQVEVLEFNRKIEIRMGPPNESDLSKKFVVELSSD